MPYRVALFESEILLDPFDEPFLHFLLPVIRKSRNSSAELDQFVAAFAGRELAPLFEQPSLELTIRQSTNLAIPGVKHNISVA
jgi:hypothetical protein